MKIGQKLNKHHDFKDRLKEAMNRQGVSQSDLVRMTGIPKSALSQYLSGAFEPKKDRLSVLAQVLNVNEAWLQGYDSPMRRKYEYTKTETDFQTGEEHETACSQDEEPYMPEILEYLDTMSPDERESILNDLKNREQGTHALQSNAVFLDSKKIYLIPVYETVSAGFGSIADDNIVDYTPLYFSDPGEADESICIKVKGDSMYPKIEDGDIIQVHRQDFADNGALAVVLVDGEEALVKRIEYGRDRLELHSINPMYPPRRFTGSNVELVRILGVVRKIIKSV